MNRLLLAMCLVLAVICCVPVYGQCGSGSCSLPGSRIVQAKPIQRLASVRRGGLRRLLPRNR